MDKRSRTNFIFMFPFVLLLMASCMPDETMLTTNPEQVSSSTSAGNSTSTSGPIGSIPNRKLATTGISTPISTEAKPCTPKVCTSILQTKTSTNVTKGPLSTIAIILIIVVVVIAVVVIMGVVVVNIQKESGEYKL